MKLKLLQKLAVFAVISSLLFSPAKATNYYVSALTGDNTFAGTSSAQPFATIKKAADLTNPGDTVYIMNGTYNPVSSGSQSIVTITRSGTDGAYITYKPFPGHTPKLQILPNQPFQVWRAVAIKASYIIWEGTEIEGANQSLDYAGAYQSWQDYENNIRDYVKISMYNCGAMNIGADGSVHHIIIRNNKIHDLGGGIGCSNCDYMTIENNLIYNTCWYSMYAPSAISILDPKSIDGVTGYKMFVRNNVVYNNKALIPWERINALSDGNGIIMDINDGSVSTNPAYIGRYLVENNVSYNNGGGGVHIYKAAHVDVINNTAYNNGTVVGYPEIDANQCSDVKIYNNIMYARSGGNCNGNDANTIYDYNLYFNGPSYKNGPHDMTANPQFVVLATDATANLQLKNISPAINNGSNTAGQFSATDILGIARPVGFTSDKGAYEYATVIARNEMKISQAATEIIDNTGSFDFGDVSSTAPRTVTFTIDNIGDLPLNLTGTPRVVVANTTGTGFSLVTDAPATVAASGSATFQVRLSPAATAGNYAGTISIANDDADENPYNFAISGYGYDGNKALQTITFNPLPLKVIGNPDFNPGATSSAGLAITYTSSNTGVATIVAGQIHIVAAGTSTITASQPGDATTNPARSVTQLLTVTPVLPPPGTNMVSNPTFDVNTNGWSFSNKANALSTVASVPMAGSSTNVGKVTITYLGDNGSTSFDNVQLSTNVFLVKDRNYMVTFKANADAARNITVRFLQNASPYATLFTKTIPITTTQTTYGFYTFTSTYTGSVAYRFFLGGSTVPVYLDDVEISEEPTAVVLPISLLSFSGNLAGNKILLNWKTVSEINAKEFEVERSSNGSDFSIIGTVAAKNISGGNYQFADVPKDGGQVFYRLKLVDKNGNYRYSEIVSFKLGLITTNSIQVYPNPVVNRLSVSFPVTTENTVVSIFMADGRQVKSYNVPAGITQQSIDVSRLEGGTYFITIANGKERFSRLFVK